VLEWFCWALRRLFFDILQRERGVGKSGQGLVFSGQWMMQRAQRRPSPFRGRAGVAVLVAPSCLAIARRRRKPWRRRTCRAVALAKAEGLEFRLRLAVRSRPMRPSAPGQVKSGSKARKNQGQSRSIKVNQACAGAEGGVECCRRTPRNPWPRQNPWCVARRRQRPNQAEPTSANSTQFN